MKKRTPAYCFTACMQVIVDANELQLGRDVHETFNAETETRHETQVSETETRPRH